MRRIDDDDVRALSWEAVLAALRAAFEAPSHFSAAERVMLDAPDGGAYLTMPCADRDGWFGVKQVSVLPSNPTRGLPSVQAWYTLFDPAGSPVAAGSATLLTRMRTAAVSAIAADALATASATRLLVVGTGSLAPWMACAHAQVREYETIALWGRDRERAERAAGEVRDLIGSSTPVRVHVTDGLERAVREADVVSVATTAREPLVRGAWLRPGQHVDLVGAFVHGMRESDVEAVRACTVVVDERAAARAEAGDLHAAALEGWSWDEVAADLHEVVAGRAPPSDGRPTLFKSVGLAFEDLAVARLLAP
ncbi:ornithine cyclodeaminase family protein [soil metagenome]